MRLKKHEGPFEPLKLDNSKKDSLLSSINLYILLLFALVLLKRDRISKLEEKV
ncbi:hypothetical protein Aasi_0392 [Candidatus Amoebophilus asiaticus 5a2]|uniref:Uncharacterized protein n=1 Tax=Amoebophilus asiaticus (strain 5a2) TaxID=452471 RepID=B3ERG0_AMOA5|nr:hypothetical protein [Candidatus Amoebophilus asiaticus]ACE05812.1 hypothetical protein Aasi_0392 [Candidatus Amoebophilus asiaticus 5a2]